jgi:uncharacterized protein (TIGR00251 family)
MAIEVRAHERGCVVPVRARPGARRSEIAGEHAGALRVHVSAPADQGKANRAVAELLADVLQIARGRVVLLAGPASRSKSLLIEGLGPAEVLARLAAAMPRTDSSNADS